MAESNDFTVAPQRKATQLIYNHTETIAISGNLLLMEHLKLFDSIISQQIYGQSQLVIPQHYGYD